MSQSLFFGVDVGGTFTKTALVSDKNRLLAKSKFSSAGFSDKAFFAKALQANLLSILSQNKLTLRQLKGIGIGLPGPVDFQRGVVLSLTNIRGWDRFHLAAYLKKYFSAPVFIENDANCMCLAESRLGSARGASYALCLTLGTGVGGGLILDKELYRSPFFLGAEVGHIPVTLDGPRCSCGGRGCLESFVGNRSLSAKARGIFKKKISLEEVSFLAAKGDPRALKFWQEAGRTIGLVISGIVNCFNPEVVVVGGGVAQAGSPLFASIRKTVVQHSMKQLKNRIKVKKAALGNDAGVLGAALLAKEKIEDKKRYCDQ
jgi:glucokinase